MEQHPQKWKFATIRSPEDGKHPVSGFREFGYYPVNGGYVFYTRGVDRVERLRETLIGGHFEGADQVWNKFQQKLSQFVNNEVNGNGSATINVDYISRPDWEQYREVIKGNADIFFST